MDVSATLLLERVAEIGDVKKGPAWSSLYYFQNVLTGWNCLQLSSVDTPPVVGKTKPVRHPSPRDCSRCPPH